MKMPDLKAVGVSDNGGSWELSCQLMESAIVEDDDFLVQELEYQLGEVLKSVSPTFAGPKS